MPAPGAILTEASPLDSLLPVSTFELVIALAVTAFGALVQGIFGIGFSVVSVPILSLVNPVLAPVPQLLLAIPLAISMSWRERSHIEQRGAAWLIAGRAPGALLGLGLLSIATQRTLDAGIALSVLVAVAILGAGLSVPRNHATEFGTGIIAGIMGMVASMGGPPAALLFKDEKGPTIRATLALFFTFGLSVTVIGRILGGKIAGDDVMLALVMLPALGVGYVASSRLRFKVDAALLKPVILALASLAAGGLLIRALVG
jgi:uncharacterized membrane protein YfcA